MKNSNVDKQYTLNNGNLEQIISIEILNYSRVYVNIYLSL